MAPRINYSGLVVAGLGFFLTRFTVTLALYETPVRFLLAGVIPLTLGLGVAAFGVALTVGDAAPSTARTVALWAVIGAGSMFVLALLTLVGSSGGELPPLATARSRAYLSNFLIGGMVGGTLTGLYADRNRRHRQELNLQANRLEVLNRILRHEVLNAVTGIRGYAQEIGVDNGPALEIVQQRVDDIEETIVEVRHLAQSAREVDAFDGTTSLREHLETSVETISDRYPDVDVSVQSGPEDVMVRADERLTDLFSRVLEQFAERQSAESASLQVDVATTDAKATISFLTEGEILSERERALLETGEISRYDDPSTGFELNVSRLLVERFGGGVETQVVDGETKVTVRLPRASTDDSTRVPLPTGVTGVRPALPQLAVIFGASMLAGVFWGLGAELFGSPVAGIGVFYGTASPIVGWVTHQFHSVVFAFVYAGLVSLLPAKYHVHVSAYVAVGLGWGLALWLGAAGIIAPVWLRLLGIPATIPNLSVSLFVAHISWGVSLGILTAWGYDYLVPKLAAFDWPADTRVRGSR